MREALLTLLIGLITIGIIKVSQHKEQRIQKVQNNASIKKSFCPERISDGNYFIITMRYGERVRHKKCWTDPCTGKAMSEFID